MLGVVLSGSPHTEKVKSVIWGLGNEALHLFLRNLGCFRVSIGIYWCLLVHLAMINGEQLVILRTVLEGNELVF